MLFINLVFKFTNTICVLIYVFSLTAHTNKAHGLRGFNNGIGKWLMLRGIDNGIGKWLMEVKRSGKIKERDGIGTRNGKSQSKIKMEK